MNDRRDAGATALTLLFAPGQRPDAAAVLRLAERQAENTAFSISHIPARDEGWVELLSFGLTFDLSGLAPLGQAPAPPPEHLFGLTRAVLDPRPEAIRLVPGPHLTSGRPMQPVLRVLAGIGAELARLPGVRSVGWEPARSWMAPAYYMSAIRAWLAGGAFPALGLTALTRSDDGAMTSEGLDRFCGCEVRVEALAGETSQATSKLAARIIHRMVEGGEAAVAELADEAGRPLLIETRHQAGLTRIWRQG